MIKENGREKDPSMGRASVLGLGWMGIESGPGMCAWLCYFEQHHRPNRGRKYPAAGGITQKSNQSLSSDQLCVCVCVYPTNSQWFGRTFGALVLRRTVVVCRLCRDIAQVNTPTAEH